MGRRRWFIPGISLALILILAITLIFSSCASPSSPTTTTAAPAKTPSAEAKTLKIGQVAWFGQDLGLEYKRGVEVAAGIINDAGGLLIGGDKYKIQVIAEDDKGQRDVATNAVEKLIDQDKVQFILGDDTMDSWIPIAEKNKVLTVGASPVPGIFSPDLKYSFQGTAVTSEIATLWGWFAKNNPNVKTVVCSLPDNEIGHFVGDVSTNQAAKSFGLKVLELIYYPFEATDLSSVAAKVKALNPDVFCATVGGPAKDGLVLKAVHEAGYTGKLFLMGAATAGTMGAAAPAAALEGLVCGMNSVEMQSPPPVATSYKNAYIAKYGKWEDPDTLYVNCWYCLQAGLEQAQSIDPDKVAAVISNGMKFESINGPCVMVSRPDLNNPRTVDMVLAFRIKSIQSGKAVLLHEMTTDEAYSYTKAFYGW